MKISDYCRWIILLAAFLFFSCQTCPHPTEGDARCDEIAEKGFINVLNINVFLGVENLDTRLGYIANFVAESDVDVILLQEIVGGSFAGTDNSAQDLREILRDKHDLDYNISTAWELGEPNIFSTANAILSRCEIKDAQCKKLPFEHTLKMRVGDEERAISIRRNVHMVRLDIPEGGRINVYNTHLCSKCDIDGRARQAGKLLEFVNKQDAKKPGDYPSILGGDFNTDRFVNQGAERFLWRMIINNGFMDAYADFIIANSGGQETLDTLCEDKDNADEHCTKGVTKLDEINGRRIDYVFSKYPATIRDATVVFNELVNEQEPTVSDHAGVFISLDLP
jgi:maltose 6'-phosphate phosphatase